MLPAPRVGGWLQSLQLGGQSSAVRGGTRPDRTGDDHAVLVPVDRTGEHSPDELNLVERDELARRQIRSRHVPGPVADQASAGALLRCREPGDEGRRHRKARGVCHGSAMGIGHRHAHHVAAHRRRRGEHDERGLGVTWRRRGVPVRNRHIRGGRVARRVIRSTPRAAVVVVRPGFHGRRFVRGAKRRAGEWRARDREARDSDARDDLR
jgi:hypothetical protein